MAAVDPGAAARAFKAYDIRGRVPDELNETVAEQIGFAMAYELGPGEVVVGSDVRLNSPALKSALSDGFAHAGRQVVDIGLCGTEEVYFQNADLGAAGGVMVTASHNPMDYNGMKLVREGARPISGDTGLFSIRDQVISGTGAPSRVPAHGRTHPDKSRYVQHLLGYVDADALKPLKIVVNAGNGGAAPVVTRWPLHCPSSSYESNTNRTAGSRTAFPTRCCPKAAAPPSKPCARPGQTWGSPGMAISTVASSST